MKKLFIGIDFSKKTFDIPFFERGKIDEIHYAQFNNSQEDYRKVIKWIKENTSARSSE